MARDDDEAWYELKSAAGRGNTKSESATRASSWWSAGGPGRVGSWLAVRVGPYLLSPALLSLSEGADVKRRKVTPPQQGDRSPIHIAPIETRVFDSLPNLVEHLAVNRYEDGMPRRPGRLFLETMGVSWVVILKEPDESLEMRVVGATLDDALALAELLLGADDPPWMPDSWAQDRQKSRRK